MPLPGVTSHSFNGKKSTTPGIDRVDTGLDRARSLSINPKIPPSDREAISELIAIVEDARAPKIEHSGHDIMQDLRKEIQEIRSENQRLVDHVRELQVVTILVLCVKMFRLNNMAHLELKYAMPLRQEKLAMYDRLEAMKLLNTNELRTSIEEIEATIALYSSPTLNGTNTPGSGSELSGGATRPASPAVPSRAISPADSQASTRRSLGGAEDGLSIVELVQHRCWSPLQGPPPPSLRFRHRISTVFVRQPPSRGEC